ncbi:hypothetical protein BCR36DRAFT_411702 [Piromyces finnis]|uniref:Uncharacterized protein n=1 Tax=Piromyces finnis TaxID=1754191 RepID=A0A1Y1VDY5_9FUNG|nr:hypothetical protein BCR36DRAFT_411702 [Piromyces finnis]|eukprot:ORX52263.1 hypothetical protein BCR36DRAFT_411702 [Piromyces finnis]
MEFIQSNFLNKPISLYDESLQQNIKSVNNTNENNNENTTKLNTITTSPLLNLISHSKKEFNNNKEHYKLSPSASISSIVDYNASLSSSSMSTVVENENIQSKHILSSIKTPILSNENLNELISFSPNKCKYPYTPSSSLLFASSKEFVNQNTNENTKNNANEYLNVKEVVSSLNENKTQSVKPTDDLLKNIYNMEIYGPFSTKLNDYSNISNQETKDTLEANNIETSILRPIDTYIDYSSIKSFINDDNPNNKSGTQKDQIIPCIEEVHKNKNDEIQLSIEKKLYKEEQKNKNELHVVSELKNIGISIMDIDYENNNKDTKENKNSQETGSLNEPIIKAKKKDKIDIILGKKIKKLIKKKDEEEIKKKIKSKKSEITILSDKKNLVEMDMNINPILDANGNKKIEKESSDEHTVEKIKDNTHIQYNSNNNSTSNNNNINSNNNNYYNNNSNDNNDNNDNNDKNNDKNININNINNDINNDDINKQLDSNLLQLHQCTSQSKKTPLKPSTYVTVNNKSENYVFKKNPHYKSKEDLKLHFNYPQNMNMYGQTFNYSSSPSIGSNTNVSQYNNQIPYNMPMEYNISTPIENATITTNLNSSLSIDLSQNIYTQINRNSLFQPVTYNLPHQHEINSEGNDEDTEKKEELIKEYEDFKEVTNTQKDEKLLGNKKTLHKKIKLRVQKKEKLEKLKQELKKDSSSIIASCDLSDNSKMTPKTEKKNIKFNIKKRLKLRINHQNTDDDMNRMENESTSRFSEILTEKCTTNVAVDANTEAVNITPIMNPISTTYMTPAAATQPFVLNSGNLQNNLLPECVLNNNNTNLKNDILYYQKQDSSLSLEKPSQSSDSYNFSILQIQSPQQQQQQQQHSTQHPSMQQQQTKSQINQPQSQLNSKLQATYSFNSQIQNGMEISRQYQQQQQQQLGLQLSAQYQQPLSTQNNVQCQLPITTLTQIPIQTVMKTDNSPQIQIPLPPQLTQIPIIKNDNTTTNDNPLSIPNEIKNEDINILTVSIQQSNKNQIKPNNAIIKDINKSHLSPINQLSQTTVLDSSIKTENSIQNSNKIELNESSTSSLLNLDLTNINIPKVTDISGLEIPIEIQNLDETADQIFSSLYNSSNSSSTVTAATTSNNTSVELPNLNVIHPMPDNAMDSNNNNSNNIMINADQSINSTTSMINLNSQTTSTIPPVPINMISSTIPLVPSNIINSATTTINHNFLNATGSTSNILGPVISEGLMNYTMYQYNTSYSSPTATVSATNSMNNLITVNPNTTTTSTNLIYNNNNNNNINQMPNYSVYPVDYQNFNVASVVPDYVNFKSIPHVKFEKIQKPKKVYYKRPKIYNTKKRGRQ